jgi:LuxR family transcriptional regulator, maltose regulon positive regulatory protein
MEASLLATKTAIPPARPWLVPRNRLFERLREGLSYGLILVSAPAGFGKTTLLSEWARHEPPTAHTSWVSLDERDSDPVRFWDYTVAALETLRPDIGEMVLPLLHSPRPLPVESVLVTLINELSSVSEDVVLVLDDYQFVRSQEVHAGVVFLLDHMPASMRVVIATRADPPLPLARWRGRGQMLEVGADELRFTVDEAAELLKTLRGSYLPTEDVAALTQRTEGWAVGLKMAALSMRPGKDPSEFIATFAGSQRYVMDYLIEEVLRQQPHDVEDFLLKTSVLEKLTAPLCDAVTGRTDSRSLLPTLERANLFLVPLDEDRSWFRYEHLFAELLRHQLKRESGEEMVAQLHGRASEWYDRAHMTGDAIHHALTARDWERAASLIAGVAPRHWQTGETMALVGWLRALPEETLDSNPSLSIDYAIALLFTGQLDAAADVLQRLEPLADRDSVLLGRTTACRALLAIYRGETRRAAELAHAALPSLPATDVDLRASLSVNLGIMTWYAGLFGESEPLLTQAYETARQSGNPLIASTALSFLSSISQCRGNLHHAIELSELAIELAGRTPASAAPHQSLGSILYELNELDSAERHLKEALDRCKLLGLPEVQESVHHSLMCIGLARGDDVAVREAIQALDRRAATEKSPIVWARQAGYHVQLALAESDVNEAARWGGRLTQYGDVVPFYLRHLPARLLIAQGRNEQVPEEIWKFYESVHVRPLAPEWKGWLIRFRVYQALSASTPDEALGFLAEALTAGETEGWIRTFVDEGPALAQLLRKAVTRGMTPDYAARLLTIIEAEARDKSRGKSLHPAGVRGLLTERESEILRLLAAGLSNREIAQRLFISLGTVKVHVHNISEKLNVTGRSRAVARARELKLI